MHVTHSTTIPLLIKENNSEDIQKLLTSLSGFEVADIFSKLSLTEQVYIFNLLPSQKAAETFDYLSPRLQRQILESISTYQLTGMLSVMPPDDRTALLEELPQPIVEKYIKLLPKDERKLTLELLGYPEENVGRLMTTDYIAVKLDWSIEQVFDFIRKYGKDSETIDVIYVVDDQNVLIDDIRLKELLFHPKDEKIESLADKKFLALQVNARADDAIKIFREYNRIALPVINEKKEMLGIVTIDDILRLASEEDTTDVQKIGGSEALDEPYTETPFFELVKKRARWLIILFIGELFTATAMGYFQDEISQAVVLALFLPLIISSGGNAGSQSSTLIIRAMALGEIKLLDWWRIMKWEILIGVSLGLILGTIGFTRVTLWGTFGTMYGEHWFLLAITIFFSLIGVVLWGSLAGAMLPFLLRRLGFDPATSSTPLVATLVDVTGIVIYFSVAMIILRGSLL